MIASHIPPFSRTTRLIAWEFAQLSTLEKMATYDWLVGEGGRAGENGVSNFIFRPPHPLFRSAAAAAADLEYSV